MSQTQTVGKYCTTVVNNDDVISVVYHSTEVVRVDREKITLKTGGWKSATTKTRMNQAANQFKLPFYVFQKNFQWFVDYKGETIPFDQDTLILQ